MGARAAKSGHAHDTPKLNAPVADLHGAMSRHVERGDIPGIVTLVGRGDEIYVEAINSCPNREKAPSCSSATTVAGVSAWE
jgi:hypothetical protein